MPRSDSVDRSLTSILPGLTLADLAADLSPGGGRSPRLLVRGAAVAAMFAGAAAGALLLRELLALPLATSAFASRTCAVAAFLSLRLECAT